MSGCLCVVCWIDYVSVRTLFASHNLYDLRTTLLHQFSTSMVLYFPGLKWRFVQPWRQFHQILYWAQTGQFLTLPLLSFKINYLGGQVCSLKHRGSVTLMAVWLECCSRSNFMHSVLPNLVMHNLPCSSRISRPGSLEIRTQVA